MDLHWLPKHSDWSAELKKARDLSPEVCAPELVNLANTCIDFIQTGKIDRQVLKSLESLRPYLNRTKPVRLALIGSSTLAHLSPAIRVAALRRGFLVDVFEGDYGMYHQELADVNSKLYAFKPDVVLLALDAHHVAGGDSPSAAESIQLIESCWKLAQNGLGAAVIQQTILSVFPPIAGNNEHQLGNSPANVIADLNHELRSSATRCGVHLLAVDALAQEAGVRSLYDPSMWHRSKQEIHPAASPIWGEHVGRLLGALRGLSFKCLVLDLDNTLWGGVIGDDGLEGIRLGQGSESGEAYVAFQKYVLRLASRGVILAVCSKNDESNARAPFERHPEMLLRSKDIACFVANWQDKATNLRYIARTLNIGLDSLVFADDNPFERNLVRQELPMVAVPELPEDPALYVRTLADGGYFETLSLTLEDRERTQQYQSNAERERLRGTVTDMSGYLRGLEMQMIWLPFEPVGLSRVVQLVNKSNQFNLTTRRYTHEEVGELMRDANALTLQIRLVDRFGDNGTIAVIIGRQTDGKTLEIDSWLMSCRVLGRQVEEATLNLIVERARKMGVERMIGVYLPSAKNGMVKEHYRRLGFAEIQSSEDGSSIWNLDVSNYEPRQTFIHTLEGALDKPSDLRAAH